MAPKYKLWYFNGTGFGETVRYVLHYGDLEFDDVRFEVKDWPKLKPSTPFSKVPVLEVDGKQICQSSAICRYLAREIGGLTGKSDWDALQIDAIVDTITDLRIFYGGLWTEPTEEKKAQKLDEIKKVHNPFYLSKLEEIAKRNGGQFVKSQLTWADLYFAATCDYLSKMIKGPLLTSYPTLSALKRRVNHIPSIKAYLDKRPETDW